MSGELTFRAPGLALVAAVAACALVARAARAGEPVFIEAGEGADLYPGAYEAEATAAPAFDNAAEAAGGLLSESAAAEPWALNPEITITGDFRVWSQRGYDWSPDWQSYFRDLGIHFQADLDDRSSIKATFPVRTWYFCHGAPPLEDVYFTRRGALAGADLTVGRFRQPFGAVARRQERGLDYVYYPMSLSQILGGGPVQSGVSLDWRRAGEEAPHEFTLQVTDTASYPLFRNSSRRRPSILARYAGRRVAPGGGGFEFGVTGLFGWNDYWYVQPLSDYLDAVRSACAYGLDFALLRGPADGMRRAFEWRTEIYYVDKGIVARDGSGDDTVNPFAAYTSLRARVSPSVDVGVRLDYYKPDVEDYWPSYYGEEEMWTAGACITWWQSPSVRLRVEYDYIEGVPDTGGSAHWATLQCLFAAGPHAQERY